MSTFIYNPPSFPPPRWSNLAPPLTGLQVRHRVGLLWVVVGETWERFCTQNETLPVSKPGPNAGELRDYPILRSTTSNANWTTSPTVSASWWGQAPANPSRHDFGQVPADCCTHACAPESTRPSRRAGSLPPRADDFRGHPTTPSPAQTPTPTPPRSAPGRVSGTSLDTPLAPQVTLTTDGSWSQPRGIHNAVARSPEIIAPARVAFRDGSRIVPEYPRSKFLIDRTPRGLAHAVDRPLASDARPTATAVGIQGSSNHSSTSCLTTNSRSVVCDSIVNCLPNLKSDLFIPTPNCPTEWSVRGISLGRPKRKA